MATNFEREIIYEIKRFCGKNKEDIKKKGKPDGYNKGFHDCCDFVINIINLGMGFVDIQEQIKLPKEMADHFDKIIS
jgi:hypothetical protein